MTDLWAIVSVFITASTGAVDGPKILPGEEENRYLQEDCAARVAEVTAGIMDESEASVLHPWGEPKGKEGSNQLFFITLEMEKDGVFGKYIIGCTNVGTPEGGQAK
jgi:hypothetical protein